MPYPSFHLPMPNICLRMVSLALAIFYIRTFRFFLVIIIAVAKVGNNMLRRVLLHGDVSSREYFERMTLLRYDAFIKFSLILITTYLVVRIYYEKVVFLSPTLKAKIRKIFERHVRVHTIIIYVP